MLTKIVYFDYWNISLTCFLMYSTLLWTSYIQNKFTQS